MNKDTNILIRVNSELKENVTNIAKNHGVSLSELITACLEDINYRGQIPIFLNRFLRHSFRNRNQIDLILIKRTLDEIIEKQEKKNLIKKAYLFGSYARGEQRPSSDIDIRIEADRGFTLIDIGNMRQVMIEAIGKDVDLLVVHPENMDPEFYKNIRKDEICIYER